MRCTLHLYIEMAMLMMYPLITFSKGRGPHKLDWGLTIKIFDPDADAAAGAIGGATAASH